MSAAGGGGANDDEGELCQINIKLVESVVCKICGKVRQLIYQFEHLSEPKPCFFTGSAPNSCIMSRSVCHRIQ